jgi:hypothetical protein
MPKATAVFDADDSRFGAALTRINGMMLALQSRIAKFAVAFVAIRAVARTVGAGFDQLRSAFDLGGSLNDLSANSRLPALHHLSRQPKGTPKNGDKYGDQN